MPPRSVRRQKRIRGDTVLFVSALLVLVVGFGLYAAYENGYFDAPRTEPPAEEVQEDDSRADQPSSIDSQTSLQPTLLHESDSNRAVYDALSDPERESLQRMADAIDVTLLGARYRGELSDADLAVAERYRTLIDPVRRREFWFRRAVRTPGFSRFQRLRDRGDEDELKSATIAWVQLNGFNRGVILEALQAIAEEDREQINAHRKTIEQYPFIFGFDPPVAPLRAPRP